MAQWGSEDNSANSVVWVGEGLRSATANQTNMFNNVTPGAFVSGVAIGQFGVDADEISHARANNAPRPAHAGWVKRTVGTGGRAGRVHNEVLVAMGSMSGDSANDDIVFPDS